ncbi:hypothetical protein DKE48_019050 (plasmid) [Acinetobacter nosocomialis]|nr:hypothetical protein DKE48_019050 [Acinetobacter nosocomialis]
MTIVAVNISNNLFEKHLYKRSKPFGVISKFCFPILFGLLTWGTCYILYLIVFIVLSMSLSPSVDGRAGGAILIYPIIAFFCIYIHGAPKNKKNTVKYLYSMMMLFPSRNVLYRHFQVKHRIQISFFDYCFLCTSAWHLLRTIAFILFVGIATVQRAMKKDI